MRLESVIWAVLIFGLVISVMATFWTAQVNQYAPYMDTHPNDSFSGYTNFLPIVSKQAQDIEGDIYPNVTGDDDPSESIFGETKKAVSRVKESYVLIGDVGAEATEDLGISSAFIDYLKVFLIVSIAFGIIYILFRIRSW